MRPGRHLSRRSKTNSDGKRLKADERREQLLQTAAVCFSNTGLRATTMAAIAEAAGVSEPVLYDHFPDKESLFRAAARRNSDMRIAAVTRVAQEVTADNLRQRIRQMLEAVVSVCLVTDGGPQLMTWALLEVPEFGAELYRQEVGSVTA